MPSQEDVLFGKIAIKNRLVDEARVKNLLARAGNGKSLGRLLLEAGIISQEQFQQVDSHVRKVVGGSGSGSTGTSTGTATKPAEVAGPSSGAAKPAAKANGGQSRVLTTEEVSRLDFAKIAGKPIEVYLREARRIGASDLHFQVDSPPFVRLHGQIVYLKHPLLTPEVTEKTILPILDARGRKTFEEQNDYDFCLTVENLRYRTNVLRQRKGIDAIFRIIPDHIPTLAELRMPSVLERFTKYRQGIVLLTGPAGCGKTSTMSALVNMINREQHDHIVMVEDPIEIVIPSVNCNVNQRQVVRDTENYASALRSAMRSDPDYICVGEMRDLETVSMAITAAETGHLVFATLHTTNAVRSVDRIIDIFPPKEQEQIRAMVSESLRGVVSQNLLPRADGRGREPALEILFVNSAVGNMIREKKTFQLSSVLQTGTKQGMVAMDDSIEALLKKKIITRETARFSAFQKDRFN